MISVDFTNIDNAKLIGKLLPYWVRGRKISLFMQAILKPIVTVHQAFQVWALKKYIECHITAQKASLEWYLNYQLSSHFKYSDATFYIVFGMNDAYCCFNSGLWVNEFLFENDYYWDDGDSVGENSSNMEAVVGHIKLYAPAIVETINYTSADYERDIKMILSKYMINFDGIEIEIAGN